MLQPKRLKHRKFQRGRMKGTASGGAFLAFGDYALQAQEPGRILFELAGVDPVLAKEAMRLASYKLPIKTKFLSREGAEGESSATEGHAAAV